MDRDYDILDLGHHNELLTEIMDLEERIEQKMGKSCVLIAYTDQEIEKRG